MSNSRLPLPILALALAAFAIGTTEFVIVGILPEVASDLGVTLSSAGLLVTGYALGVAIGAPIVAALTARWPRKATLMALLGVFIAGNLLSVAASNYTLLMLSRVVASFAHGSFFGTGAVVASSLVTPDRRAGAIALMFTGLTLANVLGVPLGTLIGQTAGWRATFLAVSVLGVLALAAVATWVPRNLPIVSSSSAGVRALLRQPQLLLALLLTVFAFGGVFTAFTFITPMLQQLAGFSPRAVTAILFLFGLGLTLGNAIGGRLADWKLMPSMVAILVALVLVEWLMSATITLPTVAVFTVFAWGVAAFAAVPGLQIQVVNRAQDAPTLASTLNVSAFNVGNAAGAWLGSSLIAADLPLRLLPVAASTTAATAIGIAVLIIAMDQRSQQIALRLVPRPD